MFATDALCAVGGIIGGGRNLFAGGLLHLYLDLTQFPVDLLRLFFDLLRRLFRHILLRLLLHFSGHIRLGLLHIH
jgi:hypothetical protein